MASVRVPPFRWLLVLMTAALVVLTPFPSRGETAFIQDDRGVLTAAPMLERVTPAIVNIATRTEVEINANPLFNDPFFRRFFDLPPGASPQPRSQPRMSAGSGVIIDADEGYVLTNHHVIANASAVTRSGVTGIRMATSLTASASNTIRPAFANRPISERDPYPMDDSNLSIRELEILDMVLILCQIERWEAPQRPVDRWNDASRGLQ